MAESVEASRLDISSGDGSVRQDPKVQYLFEPSMESVIAFFYTQIPAYRLIHSMQESNLAELGSRITSMYAASDRIEGEVARLFFKLRTAKKGASYKKQMQRIYGMFLWS